MKIAVLSDTHNLLRPEVIEIIKSRRQPVRWAGSPSAFCYLVSVAIAAGEKCRWQELWCA